MLFGEAVVRVAENTCLFFQEFKNLSGLGINCAKSSLFVAGVEDSMVNSISSALDIRLSTLPIRYLGIPLF